MSAAAQDLSPQDAPIRIEDRGPARWIWLDRPKQFNALSEELLVALTEALEAAGAEESVRVVVIAAEGKAFCAGHDLKQMRANPSKAYYQELFAACSRMMLTVQAIPKPVVARVQGLATAAGCQLVAQCDLAVTVDHARFATSGINAGLFCSTPAVAVTRNIPRKMAAELLFTGDFIDAETALSWGLVNRVVPEEELDQAVDALTGKIAAKSAVAVATGKKMVYTQLEKGIAEAYDYAAEMMACNMMAEDAGEGIDAFIGKRPPEWKHR